MIRPTWNEPLPRRLQQSSGKHLLSASISEFVQVFGRRDADTIPALLRPASKKRQGTKSRKWGTGGAAGLWRFSRGT